jgi:hypothetical protein
MIVVLNEIVPFLQINYNNLRKNDIFNKAMTTPMSASF